MTYDDIKKRLSTVTTVVDERADFPGLIKVPTLASRLVFAQLRDGKLRGLSFWVAGQADTWILGLWNSKAYEFRKSDRVLDCLSELLSGTKLPLDKTPNTIAKEICDKYELVPVDLDSVVRHQ